MAEQWGDRIATVADVLDAQQFPADEAFRSHLARAVLDAIESGADR